MKNEKFVNVYHFGSASREWIHLNSIHFTVPPIFVYLYAYSFHSNKTRNDRLLCISVDAALTVNVM